MLLIYCVDEKIPFSSDISTKKLIKRAYTGPSSTKNSKNYKDIYIIALQNRFRSAEGAAGHHSILEGTSGCASQPGSSVHGAWRHTDDAGPHARV